MKRFSWTAGLSSISLGDLRSLQIQFINSYIEEFFLNGYEPAIEKFADYKKEYFPKNLFKFFSPTIHNLINLESKRLWLSPPKSFNDPFDSYVGIEKDTYIKYYILKELKRRGLVSDEEGENNISMDEYLRISYSYSKDDDRNDYRIQRLMSEYYAVEKKKSSAFGMTLNSLYVEASKDCFRKMEAIRNLPFRIACFSAFGDDEELGENTTMWSHYAGNHKGFCVRYSVDFEASSIRKILNCGLYKVMYSNKISNAAPRELLKAKYDDTSGEIQLNKPLTKAVYRALVTKSRFWSYEKEWRLVVGKENQDIMSSGSVDFPFISAIYLGCKIDDALKGHLLQFAKSKNIPIYQARQNSEKFNLEFFNLE